MNNKVVVNYKTSEKVRRNLLAIAACFGGFITLTIMFLDPTTIYFNAVAGVAWLSQAFLFKFSKTELDKLYLCAFIIISFQFSTTELLALLFSKHSLTSFYIEFHHTSLILILFILICFIFFDRIRAIKVSSVGVLLTISTYIYCAISLGASLDSTNLTNLIEPIIYIAITLYLTNTLSLFRIDASSAKIDAQVYEQLAFYDELTGIANRRKLVETLRHEIAMSQRYDSNLSIIMFDIDHFKSVNDTYGHNIGDVVLKSIANSAKHVVRRTDSFGRWGGEEFLCILPNTSETVAYELAERLRINLANTVIKDGPQVTASFGIAQFSKFDDFDSFVNRADDALYNAKEQGRNCCLPKPTPQISTTHANTSITGHKLN